MNYPYFFTATILEWKHLLKPDKYKDIIIKSLLYLSEQNKVKVFGLVIMPNHIHLIYSPLLVFKRSDTNKKKTKPMR